MIKCTHGRNERFATRYHIHTDVECPNNEGFTLFEMCVNANQFDILS